MTKEQKKTLNELIDREMTKYSQVLHRAIKMNYSDSVKHYTNYIKHLKSIKEAV